MKDAVIIDGVRTPVGNHGGALRTLLAKVASKQWRDMLGAWGGVKKTKRILFKPGSGRASIRLPMMRA